MAPLGRTAIVGVGLIGGSLGLALKRRGLAGEVVGSGWRESTLRRARERGAIDRWTLDAAEAADGADLVALCTPVRHVTEKAEEALAGMGPGSVLTDVASTKATLTRAIEGLLPDGVAFVPGHPMAGSEKQGIESARADLFEGESCILTPTDKTPSQALGTVRGVWEGVGARVELLDPEEHDRIMAQVSHLPHLVATMVVNAVADEDLRHAARGMKDATRIAGSDAGLWVDILKDNREKLLAALEQFGDQLDAARSALECSDWERLAEFLGRACRKRSALESEAGGENGG